MAFRFPLASVLRVREGIEKREEVALQRAQLEVARVQRRIDELTDQLAAASKSREKALEETIQASRLQNIQAEINAALEAKQTLFSTLQTLRRQRDAQMKLYKIAHSGRQMVSDLLTQQKNAYEHEQLRIQQKRLDDIVASRWQRR
jgi:flagellar export protein FliJ